MVDIYFRNSDDAKYQNDLLETSDIIEMVIYKLHMIILTDRGDVLGEPNFGLNLDELIFDIELNENELKKEIDKQLINFIPEMDDVDLTYDIKFYKGTRRDICIIDFNINKNKVISVAVN